MDRIVIAHTPLGDTLRFRAMHGTEAISELFEFDVELLADTMSLDLKALLGQSLTLEITTASGKRYLDGLTTRCVLVGREDAVDRQYRYRATVRPWLWLLTRRQNCKIFQSQSVPDILQAVLGDYGFAIEKRLTGSYRQWNYCVQYQETDFDFVSRLMEHEGIYYFFQHAAGSHTLVLTDDIGTAEPFAGYASIPFFTADRVVTAQEECISDYQVAEEMSSGSYVTDDYNFTTPRTPLQNQRANPGSYPHGQYEVYDWLGGYSEHGESDHYSRTRLEELQSESERDWGHGTARGIAPGYKFTLRNCPRDDANRDYLVVSVSYRLREPGYASTAELAQYDFDFVTQPTSLPFRPPRNTPKPYTNGPQTAVVVGPAGEEIWTDQYGRIKVQFRWDRYGTMDENSSCWVRVSSSWAGSTFGGMYIPRIGQEVIVDFIAGEPDRPIVIGCTYNADQMPPFPLPANASQSGFISRTVKGTPANANAIRFEDKPGSEQLWFHAEQDHLHTVERDKSHDIGRDRAETIHRHSTQNVEGNKATTIVQNYTHQTQGMSDRAVTLAATENYAATWNHTTVGPSTALRMAPHSQTYQDTYSHTVVGLADQTYQSDESRTNQQTFTHTVVGDHIHAITGNHTVTVEQDHDTTVTGNHSTTVQADHTVTVSESASYHTGTTHSVTAGDVSIKTGGGGGGGEFSLPGGASGSVTVSTAKITAQSLFSLDATVLKGTLAALNMSIDGIKIGATVLNTGYNIFELKRNEVGKKEYTFYKNETISVENKNVLTSYQKGSVHTVKSGLCNFLGGGAYRAKRDAKPDEKKDFNKKFKTQDGFDQAKRAKQTANAEKSAARARKIADLKGKAVRGASSVGKAITGAPGKVAGLFK